MQTRRLNFRFVFLAAGLISLGISYTFLWTRMIANPEERTGADFIAFYAAGTIAEREGVQFVYDPLRQQAAQQEQVGFELVTGQVLLYNHVPYLIPLLQVLVTPNYVVSFVRWALVLLALYLAGISVLVSLLHLEFGREISPIVLATCLLAFFPLFVSILNGQDTAFIFLGAAFWIHGLLRKKDWTAGIGLALTTIRPHIALLLALPFLFRRRQVFWGFLVGSSVLGIFSILLLGANGVRDFIGLLLVSAGGEWYGIKEAGMFNLLGVLFRLFPSADASAIRLTSWVVYGVAFIGLCILMQRGNVNDAQYAGLASIITLVSVPHLHYHDLALLILPTFAIVKLYLRIGQVRPANAAVFALGLSFFFLLGMLAPPLKFSIPYLVMVGLSCTLVYGGKLVGGKPVSGNSF